MATVADLSVLQKPPEDRSTEDIMHITAILEAAKTKLLCDLSPEKRCLLAQKVLYDSMVAGGSLWKEGDPGDSYYVMLTGVADVVKWDEKKKQSVPVFRIRPGTGFGEVALQSPDSKRAAGVLCETDCTFVRITAADYSSVVDGEGAEKVAQRVAYLQGMSLFKGLPSSSLTALALVLREKTVPHNTVIVREGDEAEDCYFIVRGSVRVVKCAKCSIDLDIAPPRSHSFLSPLARTSSGGPLLGRLGARTSPWELMEALEEADGRKASRGVATPPASPRPARRPVPMEGPKVVLPALAGAGAGGAAVAPSDPSPDGPHLPPIIDGAAIRSRSPRRRHRAPGRPQASTTFPISAPKSEAGGPGDCRTPVGDDRQAPRDDPESGEEVGASTGAGKEAGGGGGCGESSAWPSCLKSNSIHIESPPPRPGRTMPGWSPDRNASVLKGASFDSATGVPSPRTRGFSDSATGVPSPRTRGSSDSTTSAPSPRTRGGRGGGGSAAASEGGKLKPRKRLLEVDTLPAGRAFGEEGILHSTGLGDHKTYQASVVSVGGCEMLTLGRFDAQRRLPRQLLRQLWGISTQAHAANTGNGAGLQVKLDETIEWDRYKADLLKAVGAARRCPAVCP